MFKSPAPLRTTTTTKKKRNYSFYNAVSAWEALDKRKRKSAVKQNVGK